MAKKCKIVNDNIMEDVENFTIKKSDIYPFFQLEIKLFLANCLLPYRPFFTGMCLGEIAVLNWSDVDLGRSIIHIRKALVRGVEG